MSEHQRISIPTSFVSFLKARFGAEAQGWLDSVPEVVSSKMTDWDLTLESEAPLHGAMGLVFLVNRGDERLVLKLSWRDELTELENRALKLWSGNGAVKLHEYDEAHHASLLERLSNNTLAEIELEEAGIVAGKLIRKLGIKCNNDFPKLTDRAGHIRESIAKRKNSAEIDTQKVEELLARRIPKIENYLAHGDLGYLNVMCSFSGQWKAIDPKPMIGDLEFSTPELMWTRIDELSDNEIPTHLERIVDAGQLELQKAIDWVVIRAVDYYFWGLDNGLTIDPQRCLRLYHAFTA